MLRKLTGRSAAPESAAVATRWEDLRRSEPELATGIELQRTIQRLQGAAGLNATPPVFTAHEARDRLAAGVALLEGARDWIDVDGATTLFGRLSRSAVRGEAVPEAAAVQGAIERGSVDLAAAINAAGALDGEGVASAFAPLGEHSLLACTLLGYAIAPAFRAAALAYAGFVQPSAWDRGHCPVCAAPPLLGELRGGESRRVLRCGRCAAAWDFQRLRCVYCDTHDHRLLSALHAPGQDDVLRIDVCDGCRGYIKSMARLDPIATELLPAEDLATAHLDLLAMERGYTRQPAL